jgi:hypothetical protein
MDRRYFNIAAAAGAAASIAPNIGHALPLTETDPHAELFGKLFDILHRDVQPVGEYPNYKYVPKGDGIHRLHVLALIYARNWARDAGIEFTWDRPTKPTNPDYPWRCRAWLNGVLLDYEDKWSLDTRPTSGGTNDPAVYAWGEGRLALLMIMTFAHASRDDQSNREFYDTASGEIVYSEDCPTDLG